MKIDTETAKIEVKKINNQITLLMKKKKAYQEFIKEETDRLMGVKSIKDQAIELYNDPEFIKQNGRRRYYWEIGQIVGYSSSSIQRIFQEEKGKIKR